MGDKVQATPHGTAQGRWAMARQIVKGDATMAGRRNVRSLMVTSVSAGMLAAGLLGLAPGIASAAGNGSAAGVVGVIGVASLTGADPTPYPTPRNAPTPERSRPFPTNVTPDDGTLPRTVPAPPPPRPTTPKPTPTTTPPPPVVVTTLRPGMRSAAVQVLQTRLARNGFWLTAADGVYGQTTTQAVMALQKATGLPRTGVADPRTLTALRKGVRVKGRSTAGHVIEIDLRRQLLLIADGGKVTRVFNTSTGSGQWYTTAGGGRAKAVTPTGRFRIGRQITGWHSAPLGMLYSPKFFVGGYAIHGSLSIPGYPASHGCARVSVAAMDYLWRMKLAQIGTPVWVY